VASLTTVFGRLVGTSECQALGPRVSQPSPSHLPLFKASLLSSRPCVRCRKVDVTWDVTALGSDSHQDVVHQPQNSAGGVENRSLIRPLCATRRLSAEPLLSHNGTQARQDGT